MDQETVQKIREAFKGLSDRLDKAEIAILRNESIIQDILSRLPSYYDPTPPDEINQENLKELGKSYPTGKGEALKKKWGTTSATEALKKEIANTATVEPCFDTQVRDNFPDNPYVRNVNLPYKDE